MLGAMEDAVMWDWLRTVTGWLRLEAAPAWGAGPVHLPQGGLWSVRTQGGGPLTLTCQEGLLWLTCEGDAQDHVLRTGDTLHLARAGHVVVQALRASRFCMARRTSVRAQCTPPAQGHEATVR